MTDQFDANREEEFRECGGTLDTDSPETEAKSDEQIAGSAYPGEEVVVDEQAQAGPYASVIRGLVDVRSQLQRNPYGGLTARRPLSQKNGGVIIHYAGPAQNRNLSALARLQSYASYHCRANGFGAGATGNGLMYHIGVAEDGTKYLCMDIELDRWHCGAWPYNGTALAINIPIGEGQTPTPEQYRAVTEIVDDWLAYQKQSRAVVRGHREVGASACPGTIIMNGSVYPLRQGQNPGGGSPTPKPTPQDPTQKPTKVVTVITPDTKWAKDRANKFQETFPKRAAIETDPKRARAISLYCLQNEKYGEFTAIALGTKSLAMLHPDAKAAMNRYGRDVCDVWSAVDTEQAFASFSKLVDRYGEARLKEQYEKEFGRDNPQKPAPKPDPKPGKLPDMGPFADRSIKVIDDWFRVNYTGFGPYANQALVIAEEADRAGLSLNAALALVEQESGGRNIFGRDLGARSTVPWCRQEVTKDRVAQLVRHIRAGGTSNGVGLSQITWKDFIYEAEALGGAHLVRNQLRVGFKLLASYFKMTDSPALYAEKPGCSPYWMRVHNTYGAACVAKSRAWKARLPKK